MMPGLPRQPVFPVQLHQALDQLGMAGDVEDVTGNVATDAT